MPAAAGARPPGTGTGAGRGHRGLRHGRGPTVAVFSWSGRVYSVDLTREGAVPDEIAVPAPALDPRPDPTGKWLAYVRAGALRVASLADPAEDRILADPQGAAHVTFGLAEFIAAEELGRLRGYRWAPDGRRCSWPGSTSAGDPLAPRRPGPPGATARRRRVSGRREPERGRCPSCSPGWTTPRSTWTPAGRLPLPGVGRLGRRARPADGGAAPVPADVRLLSVDAGTGEAQVLHAEHRPALAGDRHRRPCRTADGPW